jgi:hypothetical protein
LRIGPDLEHLQMKAAAGNAAARDHLASLPDPESLVIWTAFWELNDFRPRGEGLGRIPLSEISAYADFMGFTAPGLRRRLLGALRMMDAAYLDWIRKNG